MDETRCLHHLLGEQADKTPNRIAIADFNGVKMTFKEMQEKTNILAIHLQKRGCKTDVIVGIYMEKCIEFSLAYIGALKAGGCYLPIDFSYPIPLLNSVIDDAKPLVVLTMSKYKKWLPSNVDIICLDKGWENTLKVTPDDILTDASFPDDLAYVVYSSGTTGAPKGIMCPHRGAVYCYQWRQRYFPFDDDERVACNVFFVWEMLRPLLKGIPMYIIPDDIIYDPPALMKYLHENHITRVLFTPSLLETILNDENMDHSKYFQYLRYVWLCGEVVTMSLRNRFVQMFPNISLVNLYSISECHDVSICNLSKGELEKNSQYIANQGKFCPVGKVFEDVKVVILNDKLQPQPIGMRGQIFVGGPTLARGYLNRKDLDSKKFIATPEELSKKCGPKLYCTGDWGYLLSTGELEICGRCDSMVKIRGFSIELQAVESELLSLKKIKACSVQAHGNEGEDKYLVAYVVPDHAVSKKEIRASLKARLPGYMIPSYFVIMKSVPIAPSGKLDARILPEFSREKAETESEDGQPITDTEIYLHEAWKSILNIPVVDTQENFFDVGGHSLLAARLLAMIKEKFSIEIKMTELFHSNTIVELAALIDEKIGGLSPSRKRSDDKIDLAQQSEYHDQNYVNMDLMLRAFWNACQYSHRWTTGRVFLTGATGFLGAFLLRELLNLTKVHVYCLVRESSGVDVEERLKNNLLKYGILSEHSNEVTDDDQKKKDTDTSFAEQLRGRVTVLKGDISLMKFGLSDDDYAYLSYEIDFIIHAAAVVNLAYPYKTLHGVNVVGTQNILQFASCSKIKPVHYMSTDAVIPSNISHCPEDINLTHLHKDLNYGYAQSKWVAEQLVHKARERGLPTAIYRLGNLSGDTSQGYWNDADFNLMLLLACIKTGYAPLFDFKFEMTPVDFASHVIVSLTQQISWSLGKTYHIINKRPIDSTHLFEWISTNGYPLSILSYEDWLQRMEELSVIKENGVVSKVLNILKSMRSVILQDQRLFDNENLRKFLDIYLKRRYKHVTTTVLQKYLERLVKEKIIPRPRMPKTAALRPLSNRVAVVVGASSGIGEAIARNLASKGASVVITARRLQKLEKIRNSLLKEGDVVAAIQADVTKIDDMKRLVDETKEMFGTIDILVNSAGVMYYTMTKNFQIEQWEHQVDVNCKGTMNAVAAVLPGMLRQGSGHIVTISSDAGRKVFPGLTVYSATKAFAEFFLQGIRLETAKSGIKVTSIQPGDVKTSLFELTTDQEAKSKYAQDNEEIFLMAEDIANAVAFAVTQPKNCSVNEILIEPRQAPI